MFRHRDRRLSSSAVSTAAVESPPATVGIGPRLIPYLCSVPKFAALGLDRPPSGSTFSVVACLTGCIPALQSIAMAPIPSAIRGRGRSDKSIAVGRSM